MSPRYPVVLFDFDHTLFDFETSKRVAFGEVLDEVGRSDIDELLPVFKAVERPLWAELERGGLTLETLNDRRFAGLVEAAGIDADSGAMARSYLHWLGRSGGLLPGARALLDDLSERCTLALVSNGYGEVMRARLPNFDLERYWDAVIVSSEVGAAKPHPAFLDAAFSALGEPSRAQVLLVGDSLTSDMAAADAYDIASCWYNPEGAEVPGALRIDHVVESLDQVAGVVG